MGIWEVFCKYFLPADYTTYNALILKLFIFEISYCKHFTETGKSSESNKTTNVSEINNECIRRMNAII